jgi:hypothetical protein
LPAVAAGNFAERFWQSTFNGIDGRLHGLAALREDGIFVPRFGKRPIFRRENLRSLQVVVGVNVVLLLRLSRLAGPFLTGRLGDILRASAERPRERGDEENSTEADATLK